MSDDVYEEAELDSLDDGSNDELNTPTDYANPLDLLNQVQPTDFVSATVTNYRRDLLKRLKEVREEALVLYEPTYYQEAFHACKAKELLALKANQVGLTLSACVEIARAVTGCDPYEKYPKKDGVAVCVGYGERHIGTTFYRKLFKKGAFEIIRDLKTGKMRTYRPWPEDRLVHGKLGDLSRAKEVLPSPPLIPKRFIEGNIAWVRRSEDIFSRVKFTTGWELIAANSAGDPEHLQGLAGVWLYVFDEDVAQSGWYEEALQRTAKVNGYLRWNAMPHAKTNDITAMIQRAEEEEGKPNPQTVMLRITQKENPYLSDEFKEQSARIALSMGEDVYRKRILGEMTTDSVLVYREYQKHIHTARPKVTDEDRQQEALGHIVRAPIVKAYSDNKFVIPENWTRRTFTDPGHSACATLFVATPPPEIGDFHIAYDELYITQCTAKKFARDFKVKIGNQVIEEFLFDMHGGHLRGAGDRMWYQEYQDAIEEEGVRCEATGARFRAACDKIKYREEQTRSWLGIRESGPHKGFPTVYIDIDRCPNLAIQIERFKKKQIKVAGVDQVIDEANRRGAVHAIECFCEKTEVLTSGGWKLFRDISADDKLATVNLETDMLEYQAPSRIVARRHSSEIVRFKGLKIDAEVTPNHRMLTYGRIDRDLPRFTNARDLRKNVDVLKLSCSGWAGMDFEVATIPSVWMGSGPMKNHRIEQEKEIDPLVLAEFLGWFVSEGHAERDCHFIQNKNRVTISQSRDANPGKWMRIKSILSQLPWRYYEHKNGFAISSRQLHQYLHPLGNAYNKRAPDWILQSSPRIISAFLSGAISGDGWIDAHGHRRYFSVSKTLVDQIQEMFLKIGIAGGVLELPMSDKVHVTSNGRSIKATCSGYQFSEWGYQTASLRDSKSKPNFTYVPYDGMVYCATVPNGTLVTRRNGKPLISGNCLEYAAGHGCHYVRPREQAKALDPIDALLAEKKRRRDRYRWRNYATSGRDSTITLGPQGSYK